MDVKAKAAAAMAALEKMGCPVLPGGNWSKGSLFEISAESGKVASNGLPWADYYDGSVGDFGVNAEISKVLGANGLFAEWINPGVLGVYKL